MAKIKSLFLKGANGKLAGATLYQSNGETVIRDIVTPANPKTEKQIIQRVIMHTVGQAYSLMSEICDHSFEGKKKGQECMSYFMQQNIAFARQQIATMQMAGTLFSQMYNFLPLGMKGFTPNQYQVAMGSLPQITPVIRDADPSAGYVQGIAGNTYADVISALNLQRGDQLTFLVIDRPQTNNVQSVRFSIARVILDPTNADFSQAPLSSAFVDGNGAINLPSVRNQGSFNFAIDSNGLRFAARSTTAVLACAVIVSRQNNDKWMRSTAYLTYPATEEYSLGQCIDMAERGVANPIYASEELYLNNAGEGGGSAAAAGEESGSTPSQSVPSVASATIEGVSIINGSTRTVTKPNGTTFPVTGALVVNTQNAEGQKVSVKNGSTVVASETVPANGVVTISHAWAKNTVYTIALLDTNDQPIGQSGSYKFSYEEADSDNGGIE